MTTMWTRLLTMLIRLTLVLALGCVLAGCDDGGKSPTTREGSRARLGDSRATVRRTLQEVQRLLQRRLEGIAAPDASGQFHGCETSGFDRFSSFRYQRRSAVDAGQWLVGLPYLEKVRPALQDAGFEADRPQPLGSSRTIRSMGATRNGVTVSLVENPELNRVVVTATGQCLATRPEDTDYWIRQR